jgi:hypothetical protein
MSKKPKRSLTHVGQSQHRTEQTTQDKFTETQSLAHGTKVTVSASSGRISPQLSCTILPEDKQLLNEITLDCIKREGKPLNTSTIVRALIRLGKKYQNELEF